MEILDFILLRVKGVINASKTDDSSERMTKHRNSTKKSRSHTGIMTHFRNVIAEITLTISTNGDSYKKFPVFEK